MRFADPIWLLLLLAMPWVWRYALGALGTDLSPLGRQDLLRANARPRRNPVLFKLMASATLFAFVLGVARLEGPPEVSWKEGRGLDLLVAVDVSRSMEAQDLSPDRLSAARRTVERMARRLKGDRFALMTFSGTAHLLCPFTRDQGMFSRYLAEVKVGSLPVGGTNIAAVLQASLKAFEEGGSGDRVLLILSDGEEHETDAESLGKLASQLQAARVQTFLVTVGSELGEPIPDGEGGYLSDGDGRPVVSRARGDLLASLAEASGGQHLAIRPGRDAAQQLERALMELERGAHKPIRNEARPRWYLFALMLAVILGATFWRWPRVLILLAMPLLTGFAGVEHQDPVVAEGIQALDAGEAEKALAFFEEAERRGADPRIDYNRGLALLRLGKHEEAAQALGRATARLEGHELVEAFTARGEAYAKAGDKERALQQLRKALTHRPGHRPAALWLRHLLAPAPQPPPQDSEDEKEKDGEGDEDSEGDEQEQEQENQDKEQQKTDQDGESEDEDEGEGQDSGEEEQPEPGPDAGPQPPEPSPQKPDAGPDQASGANGAQDEPAETSDAGPRSPSQGLLDSYRARQQLLPLDTWLPPQPRRKVEKDW